MKIQFINPLCEPECKNGHNFHVLHGTEGKSLGSLAIAFPDCIRYITQRSSGTLNLQGFSNEVAERSTLKVFYCFCTAPNRETLYKGSFREKTNELNYWFVVIYMPVPEKFKELVRRM